VTPFGFLPQAPNVMPARSTLTERVKAAGYPGTENFLWMDDAIGAVLDELQRKNLLNNTAILVEGDNGVTVLSDGETMKGEIYEQGTWTPAFWYYRGIRGRTNELTSNIDFQPTILDILGQPTAGDGVSLLPLLDGKGGPVRPNLYLEMGYARAVIEGDYQYIAVRHTDLIKKLAATRGFPLTHWVQWGGPHALELISMKQFAYFFDPDQLYNWKADPNEQSNLYGQVNYQPTVDHLRAVMQEQANKTPGMFKVVQ
jgi:arylsulfatase A-like enzyme